MSSGQSLELQGVLASWNDERGFGFLTMPDGSKQLFVHASSFVGLADRPQVGDTFRFHIAATKDGQTRAVRVRPLGVVPRPGSSAPRRPRINARPRSGIALLAPVVLIALVVILNVVWGIPSWIPLVYLGMSLICFAVYAVDKRAANRGTQRTPETTLHLLEFLGGWPGAVFAQQFLRHKSRKTAYQRTFWLLVGLNVVALIVVVAIGYGRVLDGFDWSWINR